jgi:hypothetical protein
VRDEAVLEKAVAVVGGDDDHRRVVEPEPLQPRDQPADAVVHPPQLAVVERFELRDLLRREPALALAHLGQVGTPFREIDAVVGAPRRGAPNIAS